MAEGALDDATFAAYSTAQGKLEHAGGYNWRESVNSTLHGLGFRDEHLDRSLETFSGGELTRASLARALAGDPGPAAARRAHQPPRHRVARVAGDASADARRRDRPGGARPLVPRGRRHLGAGARGRQDQVLQGHVAPVARREGAARAGARPRDREAADRDRQARALRRPLQRRHPLPAGVVAREEARQDGPALDRGQGRQGPRLRLQAAGALRPRRLRARGRAAEDRRPHAAAGRRDVARARRAREPRRRQRHRQDDADHGADRRARVRRRQDPPRAQRQARAARPARRGAAGHGDRGRGLRAGDRPDAQQRRARCSGSSCSAARTPRSRSTACPAASASASRWRSSSARAPTS